MAGPRFIIRSGTTILYKMGGSFFSQNHFWYKMDLLYLKDTNSVEDIGRGI